MKLILKIDERCIGTRGELQISENSAGKQRTDALSLMVGDENAHPIMQSRLEDVLLGGHGLREGFLVRLEGR